MGFGMADSYQMSSIMSMPIVKITKSRETKMVYNFSVEEDESYVLNGILSHNCRCRIAPVSDDIPDVAPPDHGDFDQWLNSRSPE